MTLEQVEKFIQDVSNDFKGHFLQYPGDKFIKHLAIEVHELLQKELNKKATSQQPKMTEHEKSHK